MLNKTLTMILMVILLLPCYVTATSIGANSDYLTIKRVYEVVELIDKELHVEFHADILVDEQIHKRTNWVTIYVNPKWERWENVENYKPRIVLVGNALQKKEDVVNSMFLDEYNNYIYNISIDDFSDGFYITFHANFTLNERIRDAGDYMYSFFYISPIKAEKHNMYFRFPKRYRVEDITVNGDKSYYAGNMEFSPSEEDVHKPIYFLFVDKDEKKRAERFDKILSIIFDGILLVVGLIVGVALGFYSQKISEKYKKRGTFKRTKNFIKWLGKNF